MIDKRGFKYFRQILGKTQKQLSRLLGTSINAVHSYEQGWRSIPAHVERQILFLLYKKYNHRPKHKPCWTIKKCPASLKKECPAWEFDIGDMCWFINGTICLGVARKTWGEKMEICRNCEVLNGVIPLEIPQGPAEHTQ